MKVTHTRQSWAAAASAKRAKGSGRGGATRKADGLTLKSISHPSPNRSGRAQALPKGFRKGSIVTERVDLFLGLCRAFGLAMPEPELLFHATRKWRFDYAWPKSLIALEVDGGIWTQGRHTRGKGVLGDHEKLNAAALAGWRVFRTTPAGLTAMLPLLKLALTHKEPH